MRPDSPEWLYAKNEGDRAELALAEFFRTQGYEPFKALGRTDFDLLLQCRVEVKHDLQAPKTGNVAIETEYDGRSSGIHTSTATFWAVVVDGQAYIMQTHRLRDLVVQSKFPVVAAGDRKLARVRLVPIEKLKRMPKVRVVPLPELSE